MSIVTKTGDKGTTGLMYGRRVSKNHPRVEACGAVDELNSALGLVRATAQFCFTRDNCLSIQKTLVALMGELATDKQDWERYIKDGHPVVTPEMTARLEKIVAEIEAQKMEFKDWVMPGGNPTSAALDIARTTCRRAERRVVALQEAGELQNNEVIVYLNRLADMLWLVARWSERNAKNTQ